MKANLPLSVSLQAELFVRLSSSSSDKFNMFDMENGPLKHGVFFFLASASLGCFPSFSTVLEGSACRLSLLAQVLITLLTASKEGTLNLEQTLSLISRSRTSHEKISGWDPTY